MKCVLSAAEHQDAGVCGLQQVQARGADLHRCGSQGPGLSRRVSYCAVRPSWRSIRVSSASSRPTLGSPPSHAMQHLAVISINLSCMRLSDSHQATGSSHQPSCALKCFSPALPLPQSAAYRISIAATECFVLCMPAQSSVDHPFKYFAANKRTQHPDT